MGYPRTQEDYLRLAVEHLKPLSWNYGKVALGQMEMAQRLLGEAGAGWDALGLEPEQVQALWRSAYRLRAETLLHNFRRGYVRSTQEAMMCLEDSLKNAGCTLEGLGSSWPEVRRLVR